MQFLLSTVTLTLKVPNVENFDLYKNCYIWQHVGSIEILSELRNQETFDGVSISTSEIDTGVLDIIYIHERKARLET